MSKSPAVKLAESRLYTVKEAAAFFSMSVSWVRERVTRGELDGYLCGNLLVSGVSMNRYLATRAVTLKPVEDATLPANAAA